MMYAIAATVLSMTAAPALSHGTVIDPPSREYFCAGYTGGDDPEEPRTAGCKAAHLMGGAQQFYDWRANVQGGHHEGEAGHKLVVPDGKICAGGKTAMRGLDAVADWTATRVTPNAEGRLKLSYLQTAAHISNYFRTYISTDSYDFSRPLRWSDLQLVGDTGWLPAPANNTVTEYDITIPKGATGKRVLFNVWQRSPSDNAESFYSCSDIKIAGAPSTWLPGSTVEFYKVSTKSEFTLRIFETDSRQKSARDLERHSVVVNANTTGGGVAMAMGSKINGSSFNVRLGALRADGSIAPVNSDHGNRVFGNGKNLTAVLERKDLVDPPEPPDPGFPPYVPGNTYKAGDKVSVANRGNFECRQFPASGWCSQSPPHYAPGTGSHWNDAWLVVPN